MARRLLRGLLVGVGSRANRAAASCGDGRTVVAMARPRPPRRSRAAPSRGWWPSLALTAAAVASINLLAAYLIAAALWPARVPAIDALVVIGVAAAAAVLAGLAALGWVGYLRERRRDMR